jgi:flagellar biosynthetic protein FliO|tara:strand:+ start:1643 stop:2038 length:396 start_codon:yes stop_codon:yes gene_type:complete
MLGDTQLLLQSIGSLLLVLAILLAMVFAARWFMQRRPQGGRRLRFVEAMALGSRDKLLLVEVDGKSLLLGVTAQNIRLLAELDAQDGEASALAQQGQQKNFTSEADTSGLSQKFSQLLGRHTPPVKPKDML